MELQYEIYGSGEHTIVFVPTWAIIHSRSWKAQIPYFAENFRVIAFDPRGNGKSDRPTKPDLYSMASTVTDVIAVMDATATKEAVLVGHSFSCAVSLAVAAFYPDRVSAVVSIGGWRPIIPPNKERIEFYQRDFVPNPVDWQKYNADYWLANYPDFIDFFLGRVFNEPHSTKQHKDAVGWGFRVTAKCSK